jgi:arylsulfatase
VVPLRLGGGIACGADSGSPVWDKYKPPFKFTGTLYGATVDVSGELIKDDALYRARHENLPQGYENQ